MQFVKCEVCGKIICVIEESMAPTVCCGKPMTELRPGTTDAATEKHIPAYKIEGNTCYVTVGSVLHPMTPEHSIKFICIETNKGYQIKYLRPTDEPKAEFALSADEKIEAVYEYCNLHGLWKAE